MFIPWMIHGMRSIFSAWNCPSYFDIIIIERSKQRLLGGCPLIDDMQKKFNFIMIIVPVIIVNYDYCSL